MPESPLVLLPLFAPGAMPIVLDTMEKATVDRMEEQTFTDTVLVRYDAESNTMRVLERDERRQYKRAFEALRRSTGSCVSVINVSRQNASSAAVSLHRRLRIEGSDEYIYAIYTPRACPILVGIVRDEASGKQFLNRHAEYTPIKKFCSGCGAGPCRKLRKCSGCAAVHYCGIGCQRLHFRYHKEWCQSHEQPAQARVPALPTIAHEPEFV